MSGHYAYCGLQFVASGHSTSEAVVEPAQCLDVTNRKTSEDSVVTELAADNTRTVLRLMVALNDCDIPLVRELVHPDADWWVLGIGTMNRETLITQLQAMLGSAKVAETKIIGTTAEGGRVAVESQGNFEFEDGRVYRNSYHHLFVVEDGVIRHVREYLDTALTARVFGSLG